MEIKLCPYEDGDFEALWQIDQTCFPPGIAYSRAELLTYVHLARAATMVARAGQDPKILGFIIAHASRKGLGHIITIDVLPEAQRLKVGSMLLFSAEAWMRGKDCSKSYLETAVDNLAALAFYKRHDYFLLRILPRYYSNGVDAYVLQKDLLSSAQAS